MSFCLKPSDRVGLLHPSVDVHTLGVASLGTLLADCAISTCIAGAEPCQAAMQLEQRGAQTRLRDWLQHEQLTVLGFSYRLDPLDALAYLKRLLHFLRDQRLWAEQGGKLQAVFFAGLPPACDLARAQCPELSGVFYGDESPSESLQILGLPSAFHPNALRDTLAYDSDRFAFGQDLVRRGAHLSQRPPARGGYPDFGTAQDSLLKRLHHSQALGLPPLLRAHVGPFLQDRNAAVSRFLDWSRTLASDGFLDVLSIGTSQLSQSHFFEDWAGMPDGGGVPLHSPEEFAQVWQAARPMLVRSYAGTRNIPRMARMLEENIHIAWHALSLWWFCQIDGRGENGVLQNLMEHTETLRFIAGTGKPFEANVSHHFAFRGGDDVSYVLSAYLAARLAKANGIRTFVLQLMLNTPKATWGIQDLAKARAALALLRELEDGTFRVLLQSRGGLDYFSHKPDRAMAQLAAVTALMDDIDPQNLHSPDIIHVVSYSEGFALADPPVVKESLQLTLQALAEYRNLRAQGSMPDLTRNEAVDTRTTELLSECRLLLACMERCLPAPYSPRGLHAMLSAGCFPLPFLWQCRDEFPNAVRWSTRLVQGAVKVVNEAGLPLSVSARLPQIEHSLKEHHHG